jgi:hypothetical protein
MVLHVCNTSTWEAEIEDGKFETNLGYLTRPFSNYKKESP